MVIETVQVPFVIIIAVVMVFIVLLLFIDFYRFEARIYKKEYEFYSVRYFEFIEKRLAAHDTEKTTE